jgi:hypothetical protein
MGLSVPHKKHITSPLQDQQVNTIYRFVTIVYNYHNSRHYPSSWLLFTTPRSGYWILSPSSGGSFSSISKKKIVSASRPGQGDRAALSVGEAQASLLSSEPPLQHSPLALSTRLVITVLSFLTWPVNVRMWIQSVTDSPLLKTIQ